MVCPCRDRQGSHVLSCGAWQGSHICCLYRARQGSHIICHYRARQGSHTICHYRARQGSHIICHWRAPTPQAPRLRWHIPYSFWFNHLLQQPSPASGDSRHLWSSPQSYGPHMPHAFRGLLLGRSKLITCLSRPCFPIFSGRFKEPGLPSRPTDTCSALTSLRSQQTFLELTTRLWTPQAP